MPAIAPRTSIIWLTFLSSISTWPSLPAMSSRRMAAGPQPRNPRFDTGLGRRPVGIGRHQSDAAEQVARHDVCQWPDLPLQGDGLNLPLTISVFTPLTLDRHPAAGRLPFGARAPEVGWVGGFRGTAGGKSGRAPRGGE